MCAMASINQNAYTSALPNFRNLGVLLRILIIVNVAAVVAALVRAPTLAGAWSELIEMSGIVQPLLIVTLLVLVVVNGLLQRLPFVAGVAAVVAIAVGVTALLGVAGARVYEEIPGPIERHVVLAALTAAILLAYLDLRARALSPALSEARLQALQARIRPHFLYNSINAVLSLIRQDPKRAESVLEDLADLFRVVMSDNRELAPIHREVELCRQYLEIEQLRLGERLNVVWRIDKMPRDALVPPLVLQPLVENAVYHGIEPRVEPGDVSIDIYVSRGRLHAVLRNPYLQHGDRREGNRMALANVRERLQLHFDAEATLETRVREDSYQVHISMPYVRAGRA
jgi:two-component system, LytTR family, sensor histidine kinase AlgZ